MHLQIEIDTDPGFETFEIEDVDHHTWYEDRFEVVSRFGFKYVFPESIVLSVAETVFDTEPEQAQVNPFESRFNKVV